LDLLALLETGAERRLAALAGPLAHATRPLADLLAAHAARAHAHAALGERELAVDVLHVRQLVGREERRDDVSLRGDVPLEDDRVALDARGDRETLQVFLLLEDLPDLVLVDLPAGRAAGLVLLTEFPGVALLRDRRR